MPTHQDVEEELPNHQDQPENPEGELPENPDTEPPENPHVELPEHHEGELLENLQVDLPDIGPLLNLGTQHDGRSARTWMKRVLTTFVSLWEGEKDLLESTKMDFYET